MNPEVRENIKNLISCAGGQVLEGANLLPSLQENLDRNPVKVYFIYEGGPPRDYASTLFVDKEIEEAMRHVVLGAQVISDLWLFDAITAYDVRMLERSYHSNPDIYAKTA